MLPLPTIRPTADQIAQAKAAIDTYVLTIDANPDRRPGAYPYYLFHPIGTPVYGTVMLFHGFSAKPHQMWRLADYLYDNGFNVYQPSLAGHTLLNPAKNWPQIDLKPEIANPLKQKAQQDPVLQNYLSNLAADPLASAHPSPLQQAALVARLLNIEPRLLDIVKAIQTPDDPNFETFYISSHTDYLTNAEARLAELAALPGPIYTAGLSVGGATALALAANHPDRVQRAIAYAPLLKIHGEDRRRYVNLSGPLDISESGWDPDLRFPVGAFTAADRFGSTVVLDPETVQSLQTVPIFLVLTENEDAADVPTNKDFFAAIGGTAKGHHLYVYPAKDLVPHPLVDPTEISQGMSNRFWQSLYQETLRFLCTGQVDSVNMADYEQSPNIPLVPPVS
jgi:pimeloyl-ACP methyl ester carboxylesterase